MKAIVIRQPWAERILSGRKTIETRGWVANHRGDILIVAGKKHAEASFTADDPELEGLPRGKAVGVVRLVDVRPMLKEDEAKANVFYMKGKFSWGEKFSA